MSIDKWMDKREIVQLYMGMHNLQLLKNKNKKGETFAICNQNGRSSREIMKVK